VSGVSAGKLVFPIVAVLVVLHLAVISVIFMINKTSGALSATMRDAGVYKQEATSLLAGSSVLSETASGFVLQPVSANGEVNVGPLSAYAQELMQDRRGADVMRRFQSYDVPEKAVEYLSVAAECADNMMQAQLHAIALMRSVHPLPELPQLDAIPDFALTQEEQSMTDAQREEQARTLVLGSVYGLNKQSVSQNVSACVGVLEEYSSQNAAAASRKLAILRAVMWAVTLTIIAILTATFVLLFTQLILPLGKIARKIPTGSALDEKVGFQEVRLVASAYNDVRARRDALDGILRSAAETDALTKLPNRYRFEQYILEAEESGYSAAVVLFDVNYLKSTNDTLGHLAGDKLLVTAAECIAACFGENCFRFGGDEFAAIVRDCTPESIEAMIARFEQMEKERNISVSLGYAYTDEIGKTSFKKLLSEADKKMYAHKELVHHQL
jgi:diguanylate cyclase (GGDEF)-like protein